MCAISWIVFFPSQVGFIQNNFFFLGQEIAIPGDSTLPGLASFMGFRGNIILVNEAIETYDH